jgi:DNA-binding Lrp family transcriptional regulator
MNDPRAHVVRVPSDGAGRALPAALRAPPSPPSGDEIDRALVRALQGGLPRVPRPYHAIGEALGVAPESVMARIEAMLASGAIRRIGAVPNHYRLGYVANGMSVWDVDDGAVDALGERVGALACVSHCYRRPRCLPAWRYNLFAMVHGKNRAEVEAQVAQIERILGAHARAHDVLYSTRILKKTGLRI